MALRIPLERLKPPDRPHWKSGLTTAQFGPMAEDLLAVSLVAAGGGSATVARPLTDRGIDLYLRRLQSLQVTFIQAKAFRTLSPDGIGTMKLPAAELKARDGHLAIVHLPAPHDQLYRQIFLVPFSEIRRHFSRSTSNGIESFGITANFARPSEPLADFAVDLDELDRWIMSRPGWSEIEPPVPDVRWEHDDQKAAAPTEWEPGVGQHWLVSEIERIAKGSLVLVEDRVRLDALTLLVHKMPSGELAGIHVRTQRVAATRTIHFQVHPATFFVDARLFVLLVLLGKDARPLDFCLLIPSAALPGLGYSETITIDPLTSKFAPFRVPTSEVAAAFLKAAFGGA